MPRLVHERSHVWQACQGWQKFCHARQLLPKRQQCCSTTGRIWTPPHPCTKEYDAGPRLPSKSGKARYVLQERRRFVLCVVAPVLACGSVASARAHIASGLQQRTLHASFTRGLPAAIASSSRATRGAGAARPIEPQRSSLDGGFSAGVLGGIGERHLCRAWAGCGGDSRARQVAPRGGARE